MNPPQVQLLHIYPTTDKVLPLKFVNKKIHPIHLDLVSILSKNFCRKITSISKECPEIFKIEKYYL